MIIRGQGLDGALILPAMIVHMAVRIGNHSTAIMLVIGPVEKAIIPHFHAEVGPANTVWVAILESESHRRSRGGQVNLFPVNLESRRQAIVPGTSPTQIGVESVPANFGIQLAGYPEQI